ncbi:hypothetical protein DMA11_02365 [Marinilabiliaceae bacterium JC017]|nr:hypothetical protein DMA11_02365 [Marinilabiliaceae bacterium JC017]
MSFTEGDTAVKRKIILKEMGKFVLLYPTFDYYGNDVNILERTKQVKDEQGNLIYRIIEQEAAFIETVAELHPGFNAKTFQPFFHISGEEVLQRGWFFDFYEKCQLEQIELFGLEKLKAIKYHPAKPRVKYGIKSDNDWFDLKVNISYDNLMVSLTDVRKAILKKQDYVKLGDGRLGILPEEWLKRLEGMLRFGKSDKEGVRLKKNQFALIHDLFDEIDDVAVRKELKSKFSLLGKGKIRSVNIPDNVHANLRDYQHAGFNWLVFLYKNKLGGCLADDMGLGKTLQMLSLLAYARAGSKSKRMTHLVVCPTSLIFNWKNEIEKFTPSLRTTVHWGAGRAKDAKLWKDFDVVICSYGTLSNDIEWMRKFKFHIACLDESQAIKNPTSIRYKAVSLIKANYRFVMTGTPIENSTIEIYSQMNFSNPGLLGTLNAFKNEFAGTIDNERDQVKTEQLRKLIKPFIIRRTKEQVAKDLPAKTEQVFYCTMDDQQRKVYEAFRKEVREQVINSVEIEGLGKSRLTVLSGLTKLRQICDSPALLSDEENYGHDSIKADELLRLITEKIHSHKAIVFSQFVGMLDLIEERLKQQGVPYVKLTGSTRNRQELVEHFEQNDDCRIFLISLKAGGFGLNLVSADYVFLVDPWWNPAVENQAIDRAHRIGQTKKVFAYRMICKDTIEEKILALQARKKALADDVILSEGGFVKQLTENDLEELLS